MSNPSGPSASEDDYNNSDDRRSVPWIRWSDYQSSDKDNPDLLEIKVLQPASFETRYGWAVRVLLRKGSEWTLHNLTLKAIKSRNDKLDYLWRINREKGRIKPDAELVLKTWLRKSKTSEWMLRDYEMVFKKEATPTTTGASRKRQGGDKNK